MRSLDSFFRVREAGSTPRRESLAGLTTFLAMAYIIFVNPAILSQTGMDFGAVFTATCLSAAIATFVMGVAANYPIALAPGMGQNIFFLTVVLGMGLAWQEALGAVFLSGVVFLALTLTRARRKLIESIPESLKTGIAVGIGLFIAFMGMVNAGVVRKSESGLVELGDVTSRAPLLFGIGLLVTAGLMVWNVRGALLAGIGAASIAALILGLSTYQGIIGPPPSLSPTFLQMELRSFLSWTMMPVVLVFLYMAMFDAIGTLVAVGERAGLMREGKLIRGERALMADASGTVVGAALGTSTVTAYVESATGVEEGGRTGLANMTTAALFLAALFVEPMVSMVAVGIEVDGATLYPITAPALLLVGVLMSRSVTRIDWKDLTEALPAFLVITGIPFTYSIADGLSMGFIAYPTVKLLAGRGREVSWIVWLLAVLFIARYVVVG